MKGFFNLSETYYKAQSFWITLYKLEIKINTKLCNIKNAFVDVFNKSVDFIWKKGLAGFNTEIVKDNSILCFNSVWPLWKE